MKLPIICRTCDAKDTDKLYKLATATKRYPDKLLSEILTELTHIEVDEALGRQLPQCLCGACARKLIGAYYFVKQALAANELLMNHVQDNGKAAANDCLQEVPMELCAEQHVEVKLETEDEDLENDITCTELPEFTTVQNANDGDTAALCSIDNKKSTDPLTMLESVKRELDVDGVRVICAQEQEYKADFDEDDSLDDLPLQLRVTKWKQSDNMRAIRRQIFKCQECPKSFKRPRYLKQHSRVHKPKADWFSCSFCIRKFRHIEALQTHLRIHGDSKRSANLSDSKKAKEVDVNVCKPHGYKLIECMICQNQYDKISHLRCHLQHHPEINFGTRSTMPTSELAELFYPDAKDVSEEQLKMLIRKDLAAGIYQRFYSITDQSGYEMDLDSSETESEVDCDADSDLARQHRRIPKAKYSCELCQVRCQRKYQLYDHQRQSHAWLDAPHVCGRCDARFVSQQLLRHHNELQCKNAQKRFLCHKCPLRFRWRHNLKLHIREHRITNQTFECADCKRVFDKKKSLTVHLLSVHAEESKLIPCQWCSRKFYRRDYLVKHLKRHGIREPDIPLAETLIAATSKPNGAKRITCKICNMQFDRIIDLRAHIQLELKLSLSLHQNYDSPHNYSITNESGYELQLNDSETEDEMQMQLHPTGGSMGARFVYVCELCRVQCKRKYEMIQHQRAMHQFDKMPYECELCIFKCVCKSIMDQHRQSQCHSVDKKYTCSRCSYKFMWPENLEQHMQVQHAGTSTSAMTASSEATASGNRIPTDPNEAATAAGAAAVPTAAEDVQLLQCPHCDRTYQMKARLNNHIRDVHINGDRKRKEAIKKFLCSLCGLETQSAATLVTHMRRHTGEKPFKCDLCEMAFPRHSEMISHRRMHTGEKPFHCTVCGKDFARSDKLKRHMLTHSGLKPHKCTYCDKSYRQAKDLKLHLQQHTGECPFICGTCGERFIQGKALEKHRMMRRHFDEVDERATTTLSA